MESKFNEALKVFNEMTRENPNERPTCEEILTLRNRWALNEADFENSGELMDTILSKKKAKKSSQSILYFKANLFKFNKSSFQ